MTSSNQAYIVVKLDNGFGKVTTLQRGTRYTFGRATTNKIVLSDDLCSREHAEIAFVDGRWMVSDLGSLNGSRLNNDRIDANVPLTPNDEITFGRSKFVFVEKLLDLPPVPEGGTAEKLEVRKRLRSTKYGFEPTDTQATVLATKNWEQTTYDLFCLSMDLGAAHSLPELVEVVIEFLFRVTSAEMCTILSVKENKETEILSHNQRDAKKQSYHKVSQFISSEVLATKEAILFENINNNPDIRKRESLSDLKVASLICAPVTFEDQILGLIHLYSTSHSPPLSAAELQFTLLVARQLGMAWNQLRRQGALSSANKVLLKSLKIESELVGESPSLKHVESQIQRVAPTHATVLIRGESGSGKELVARAIHLSSDRREGPFVCLNCAAITESLLESELFGHEKGAFTGATEKMIGKFEAADNGTIFLDEIGEMPLSTQAKFLRVLEGHSFERLGGNNRVQVDVRVVAATNRALEEAVRLGQFRKDLFYRLQVVEMKLPPLRERVSDVPLLADHFLKRFVEETGRKVREFSPSALEKMQKYHWPGNIRELRNVIERAVALSTGPVLDAPDIWLSSVDVGSSGNFQSIYQPISIELLEKKHIQATLLFTDWNKSRAAEILGIERSTLDRKIKSYDIKKD